MNRVLVVVNFDAGRKKAVRYKKKLQKFLLKQAKVFKFITLDELSDLGNEEYDIIIAMGGDGTINKILPYLDKMNASLGIIPCGTANLLAERLNIPSNIDKAINILKKASVHLVDAININEKISILRMGIGFDSDIIAKTPQSLKNKFGYFAYFIAGILFALRLKNKEYNLVLEEKEINVKSSCIIVANSSNMYKNYFHVGRNSKLNDGLFDVIILKTNNPIIFFFEFLKICLNIHQTSKFVQYYQTDNMKIKTNFLHTHIDGEKTNFSSDLNIKIEPKKIKIIS